MTTKPRSSRDDEPTKEPSGTTEGPDGQLYDADGLLVDEYSDESLGQDPSLEANEVPAVVDEATADDAADGGDGIEGVEDLEASVDAELVNDSAVPVDVEDEADDEIDEAHSADDLERATVGHATRLTDGPEGTAHGEHFLDSPYKSAPTPSAPSPRKRR